MCFFWTMIPCLTKSLFYPKLHWVKLSIFLLGLLFLQIYMNKCTLAGLVPVYAKLVPFLLVQISPLLNDLFFKKHLLCFSYSIFEHKQKMHWWQMTWKYLKFPHIHSPIFYIIFFHIKFIFSHNTILFALFSLGYSEFLDK